MIVLPSLRKIKGPTGVYERVYVYEGQIASRKPARIKSAFVIGARAVQGRLLHRSTHGETLWVSGRYVGTTARTVCNRWIPSVVFYEAAPEHLDFCEQCLMDRFPGPCVYRLFDAEGNLLYVGCSINLLPRLLEHANAWWNKFRHLIARWEYEVYPDHDSALHAEKMAILTERPLYNTDLTDRSSNPGRRRAAFTHLIPEAVDAYRRGSEES